jgi:hypothetical protein
MTSILTETFAIAEPFVAIFSPAFHNAFRVVNAAVSTSMWGKIVKVIRFNHD